MGQGTNRNEGLHRIINEITASCRYSPELAYSRLTAAFYHHNEVICAKMAGKDYRSIFRYAAETLHCQTGPGEKFGLVAETKSTTEPLVVDECSSISTVPNLDSACEIYAHLAIMYTTVFEQAQRYTSTELDYRRFPFLQFATGDLLLRNSPTQMLTIDAYLTTWNLKQIGDASSLFSALSIMLLSYFQTTDGDGQEFMSELFSVDKLPTTSPEILSNLQCLIHDTLLEFEVSVDITYNQQLQLAHEVCTNDWYDHIMLETILKCIASALHLPIMLHTRVTSFPIEPFLPQAPPLPPGPKYIMHILAAEREGQFLPCDISSQQRSNLCTYTDYSQKKDTPHSQGHFKTKPTTTAEDQMDLEGQTLLMVPSTNTQVRAQSSTKCSCGHNSQFPSCSNEGKYPTRCPCFKAQLSCHSLCNCLHCANPQGQKPPSQLRKRPQLQQARNTTIIKKGSVYLLEKGQSITTGQYNKEEYFTAAIILLHHFGLNQDDPLDLKDFTDKYNTTVDTARRINEGLPLFNRQQAYLKHIADTIKFHYHCTISKGLTQ